MHTVAEMNEARRIKALNRQYNFDGAVMTLGQFLDAHPVVRKSEYVRTNAARKINLEYPELANAVTEYTAWYMADGEERGVSVPKLVYDALEIKVAPQPTETAPKLEDELRAWMLRQFDTRTVDEGNDFLDAVGDALWQLADTGANPITPPVMGALVELGAIHSKARRHELIGLWQFVAEGLS